MEAMVSAFSSQFLLTEEEQMEIIVDSKHILGVKTERFLLVGKLLSDKPYNKEAFRRTMYHLWRPKVQVLIAEINQDRFSFAFNTPEERAMILQGGPTMGKLIGETLGGYVLVDLSKKAECMGSYLRVRVVIDITKPLHQSIVLRLDGETIEAKPYGKWFQQDVMGLEYRKPLGRRFGMSPPQGWSMRAPEDPDSPSSE
ncbi:unnamed protein product, partial [Prunus brigantina]